LGVPERTLEGIGVKQEKKAVSFVMANGKNLMLLGARTLEDLNLAVEPGRKKLVAAGPFSAAPVKSRKRKP
jgi:hypothetical protein